VLHQIGIGTLGPVFRTYEPTRDRLVAVKVFRLDIVPEQAQALADALGRATEASLFHPSIVEPIAAGVEGTVAYRAEEYVAAESLDVAMRHYAPAPIEKVLPFITQLAGAIDFARAAGIGHGGLHPRDIFVTPDEARATGFGVIEALEQAGIRAPVRRPYTAPERIEGRPWSTPADVFSLAAITYELLTGRRPAGTGVQIGALPDGERADAFHAVLARAMDEDPSRRYASALAFAGALESAARGEAESTAMSDVAAIASVPGPSVPESTPVAMAALDRSLATHERPAGPEPVLHIAEPEPGPEPEAEPEREPETASEPEPVRFSALEEDEEPAPVFGDEFVEEQAADAETRRPIEASHESIEPAVIGSAGYGSILHGDRGEPPEIPERGHPAMLPMAIVFVLGLLGGFGAAFFVLGRYHAGPPQPSAAGEEPAAAAPAANKPDTQAQAKQWSEQTVTQKPAAPATPPSEAPPAISEAPPGAAPAAAARPNAPRAAPARPAPSERLARSGQIVVHSTPARAGVTVNGRWRGRTPLTLENLPFGRYVIRIVQPGYRVAREEFTLTGQDATHTFNAKLESARRAEPAQRGEPTARGAQPPRTVPAQTTFTGSLYVDSRPQGATVLLDNRSVGKTPLKLDAVAIGTHVVRIELAGKQPWSSTTRVVAGEMARVTGSLEDR
jgi:protein kinase-like protein/PEGA domain-containing protein